MAFATVRMHCATDSTAFRVHGGGLIVGRIINEFGVARTVTEALKEGLEPPDATSKA
jgi:hypothetical protein